MISVLYAAISAFIICWLSLNVIKHRRKLKISLGDGNNDELRAAIAAHSNAIEYLPIALLLLFALEYNEANILIVHLLGVSLLMGRLLHAKGILSSELPSRVLGMKITIFTIIGTAAANLIYIPYAKLLTL